MAVPPQDQERTAAWAPNGMNPSTCGFCGSFHGRDGLTIGIKGATVAQQRQVQHRQRLVHSSRPATRHR
jgi:hypothetical protein